MLTTGWYGDRRHALHVPSGLTSSCKTHAHCRRYIAWLMFVLEDAMLLRSNTVQELSHAASLTSASEPTVVLPVASSHAHHCQACCLTTGTSTA